MLKLCLMASIMLTLAAPIALAHDWYPPNCCHELKPIEGSKSFAGDCGVADVIGTTAAGIVLKQRQTGLVITIPPDFPKSKIHPNTHDDQYHVCAIAGGHGDEFGPSSSPSEPYVYCLFEPARA